MKSKLGIFLITWSLLSLSPTNAAEPLAQTSGGVWTISGERSLSIEGVSPFVESLSSTQDRLWVGSSKGRLIYDCTISASCVPGPDSNMFGSDITIVTLKDGSRRAYYIELVNGTKTIFTASLKSNGLDKDFSAVNTGIVNPDPNSQAWGVPDSVVLPDGRVRLYWVDMPNPKPVNNLCAEVIKSATSTDSTGTTFVADAGLRLEGGYVDTDVIQARDGNWLMITSTGPGCEPQRLWTFTSSDGLSWKRETLVASGGINRLDPTSLILDSKTIRLYYSTSPLGAALSGPFTLATALITFGPAPVVTPEPTPTPSVTPRPATKTVTITCVKGKTVKKVSGTNPKCPAGFKKK